MKKNTHHASRITHHVIKVGGNELADSIFLQELAQNVKQMMAQNGRPPLIVHGGGKAIAQLQTNLGLETRKIDGLRVTNAASLEAAQMVLSGHSNKLIVKALLAEGLAAIGLSGVDGRILQAHKKQHPAADLGYVGEITAVNTTPIRQLTGLGYIVVLSPISLGLDGNTYNVNADEAATAVAAALDAEQLDFVSNVPGVLQDGRLIPNLSSVTAEQLIAGGVITAGMIPKVRAALTAVARGVPQARIVNLDGLAGGGGTIFSSAGHAPNKSGHSNDCRDAPGASNKLTISKLTFAPMTIDQYDEVIALWQASEGVGLSGADERENIRAYLERNPGLSFVAVDDGRIVGTILCGHDGRRGFIHHLAVHQDYRRRGVARRLTQKSVAALQAGGIQKCHIFIFRRNESGIAFWQANGWEIRQDIHIMSKHI
ncbi:MAG TPA: acetylglutamate kinase [Anaerolineae bacterium]|nr:acetylglutamate kinase [Anaerolineae bacterium]